MEKINYKVPVTVINVVNVVLVLLCTWEDPTVLSQGNQVWEVVDAVREGHVQITCQPPNSDTEFLVWQGVDVHGQPISVSSRTSSDGYSILSVPANARYNQSIFTCYSYQISSSQTSSVLVARIIFQGPLQTVSNLKFTRERGTTTSIHLTWTAPFSLNLTTAEPDIQYCVDVYNVSGGGDLVESSCDITETFYIYTPDNPSPDHLFTFTVTPRSNVPGSLNGTISEPVQGFVIATPLVIPSDSVTYATSVSLDPIRFIFPTQVLGTSPGRQPTGYTIDVLSIDDDVQCSCPTSYITIDNTVILTLQCDSSCTVERHRLFNMTIVAHNNAGSSKSHPEMEISTHDIVKVRAGHSLQQGQIDISCVYLNGTTNRGFFTIVYSSSNRSDITYRVAVRNGLEPTTNLSLTNLGQDDYQLSVYDLLDSTIPETVPAALPQQVSEVNDTDGIIINEPGTGEPQPMQVSPEVTSPRDGRICISCSFSDPRTTGCVGVIHSAELDNLTLTILPVSMTDSDISHNTGCISLLSHGDYLVAVFGQSLDGPETAPAITSTVTVSVESSSDPTEVPAIIVIVTMIVFIVVSVIILVFVTVITIVTVKLMKRRDKFNVKVQNVDRPDDDHDVAVITLQYISNSDNSHPKEREVEEVSTNGQAREESLSTEPIHQTATVDEPSLNKHSDVESGTKFIMVEESSRTDTALTVTGGQTGRGTEPYSVLENMKSASVNHTTFLTRSISRSSGLRLPPIDACRSGQSTSRTVLASPSDDSDPKENELRDLKNAAKDDQALSKPVDAESVPNTAPTITGGEIERRIESYSVLDNTKAASVNSAKVVNPLRSMSHSSGLGFLLRPIFKRGQSRSLPGSRSVSRSVSARSLLLTSPTDVELKL